MFVSMTTLSAPADIWQNSGPTVSDLELVASAVLKRSGILVGHIEPPTKTFHWTAKSPTVFMKFASGYEEREMLRGEMLSHRLAMAAGVRVPRLVVDGLVEVESGSGQRLSVLVSERVNPVAEVPNLMAVLSAVDEVGPIMAATSFIKPGMVRTPWFGFSWKLHYENVFSRLEGDESAGANLLRMMADHRWGLLNPRLHEDRVFVHGDLHTGNMIFDSQGLVIVDWESAGYCPIEFALAKMVVACFTPDVATLAYGAASQVYQAAHHNDWFSKVDWELVELLARSRTTGTLALYYKDTSSPFSGPREWLFALGDSFRELW